MNTYRHSILEIQHEKLGRSLYISLLTHLFLGVLFFILPSYINPSHDPWGSSKTGGCAIPVGLVNQSAIRGLKLPRPALTTSSNVSTDSKGLGKTQEIKPSTPETETPDPNAFEVKKKKKKKPKVKRARKRNSKKPNKQIAKVKPPPETIPFGEGGAPNLSYSQFMTSSGSGGIGLGNGFFGRKYGWYVKQIRDIVSSHWQKSLVNPNVKAANRVIIQFTIQRNGRITNEFIKKSSGIPSLDRSGIRAIKASRLPPLPGGENRLTAEFWFEHSR